jgi:hypothetical protein
MNKIYKILLLSCSLTFASVSNASEGFGTNEPKIKFVQCYPNPATTNINIDLSFVEKGYTITIYNFIGKKVEDIKLANAHTNVNLETYFRGLYIYQLRNKQAQLIESGKFQVVK